MFIWGNKMFGCDVVKTTKGYMGREGGYEARSWLRKVYSSTHFDTRAEAVAFCKRLLRERGSAGAKSPMARHKVEKKKWGRRFKPMK